ncbi:MAG: thioredoxin family protein [Fibrobacterota bacterium]
MKQSILIILSLTAIISSKVTEIQSQEQLSKAMAQTEKLMILDFYADWCQPCRMLSPRLDSVSESRGDYADFYKINTEKHPALARAFGVQGIPYVVFYRDSTIVNTMTGLRTTEQISQLTEVFSGTLDTIARGTVKKGVRHITAESGGRDIFNILVNRGEPTEITIPLNAGETAVSIPQKDITKGGEEQITVTFTEEQSGLYELNINAGDTKSRKAWIVVLNN